MKLREALLVLSKSSPFAVSTIGKIPDEYKIFKDWLYVTGDIEVHFDEIVEQMIQNEGGILFVCGSSGDGKSELLVRKSKKYGTTVDFHLDATHSDGPRKTAIDSLNERFRKYKLKHRPLVIGVNTGILGNYAEEGSAEHYDIKEAIHNFLICKLCAIPTGYRFLNFEDYPKFSFGSSGVESDFVRNIIEKITLHSPGNPFYALHKEEQSSPTDPFLATNFKLLSDSGVQKTIVELLLKARLEKNQFLTARNLLDFIYNIVCSDNYIFNTLFENTSNELLRKMRSFDPMRLRSQQLDSFLLQQKLNIPDPQFEDFKKELRYYGIPSQLDSQSYIRLFYILRHSNIGNNYHKQFEVSMADDCMDKYIKWWSLHHDFFHTDSVSQRDLQPFYKDILINGLNNYINRRCPFLSKREYLLSVLNDFVVATKLKIVPNFKKIEKESVPKTNYFKVHLMVNEIDIAPLEISLNLLELLQKVANGYQPSKHDSASILLLDDAVQNIMSVASAQRCMIIANRDQRALFEKYKDYIETEIDGKM